MSDEKIVTGQQISINERIIKGSVTGADKLAPATSTPQPTTSTKPPEGSNK